MTIKQLVHIQSGDPNSNSYELNRLLDRGWSIKSVTPNHVALASTGTYRDTHKLYGSWLIVLEDHA